MLKNILSAAGGGLVLLFLSVFARAQDNKPGAGFGVESAYIGGKVFKHSVKFKAPIPDYSSAIDINLLWRTSGTKEWQQRRHYPMLGLGLTYTDYGMDSIYGKCVGLYPVLQLPIIKGKRLEWTVKLGLGVGYVTRHYERIATWDTINNAIGSNLNNFTLFATDLRYKINHQWAVSLGASFSHISDGVWRQPNLGVNMYGAHIAVRYFPVTDEPLRKTHDLKPIKSRWLVQARLGFSFNETIAPDGPSYPVYASSLFVSKRYASRNKAYAGLDYSYHKNIEAFQKNNEINPGQEARHSWKSAAYIGNEFLMGRFGLVLQLGFYIKTAELKHTIYYQKLGYNFYLIRQETGPIKELCLYSMLKCHKIQAEFIEFGVGLGF